MKVLVLGAGQLARMMALESMPLNIEVRAYDVGSDTVVNPLSVAQTFGDLNQGIAFADVITAEFEHIAHGVLAQCEASGKLRPSSQAIKTGGDRRLEKQLLEQCGIANAKHHIIANRADFDAAISALNLPIIFKSALEGYDGKGQWRMKTADQADEIWQDMADFIAGYKGEVAQGIVAEQMVPFDRELSLVGARGINGDTSAYPLTENHHTNGVLSVSQPIAGDDNLQQQANDAFDKLTNQLGYVGILAIEFFQVGDKLLVNEIAPRVHNSGHWTQQGADVSQFENHIRAVSGLPLGNTDLVRPTAMINVLGEDTLADALLAIPSLSMHWYGKSKRPGRKMGHINISGDTNTQLTARLKEASMLLPQDGFEDIIRYINR